MAKNKLRLDMALVEQGLFASRNRAQASIMAGEVLVNSEVETRADRTVLPEDQISLKEKSCPYVSRGGLKLAHALKHWHIDLTGKTCVDIGVATGGFSDCMLQAGAKIVYGVDVGKGQLADEMRRNPNFIFKPETNARYLTPEMFDTPFDFAAVDVSFISLTMIMAPLFGVMAPRSEIVFLIKPQFELGHIYIKNGVVKDEKMRQYAIKQITSFIEHYNIKLSPVIESPIKGGSGNTEYLSSFKL